MTVGLFESSVHNDMTGEYFWKVPNDTLIFKPDFDPKDFHPTYKVPAEFQNSVRTNEYSFFNPLIYCSKLNKLIININI